MDSHILTEDCGSGGDGDGSLGQVICGKQLPQCILRVGNTENWDSCIVILTPQITRTNSLLIYGNYK